MNKGITKRMNLSITNDLPLIPDLGTFHQWITEEDRPLIKEPIIIWAAQEWKERFGNAECIVLWGNSVCLDRLALQRVKPGHKLGKLGIYLGFEPILCPIAIPISWRQDTKVGNVPAGSAGAALFTFDQQGQTFTVLFVCVSYFNNTTGNVMTCPVAFCPPQMLSLYHLFERACNRAVHDVKPSPRIQVIGGQADSFEARVDWNDLILGESLKTEIKHEVDAFFDVGVKLYRELKLPPFRKLLFVGPPGTGKSTLCAALAKHAIKRKMLVIYVSASDPGGASFGKIYQALRVVAEAKYPTLLIIEEIDVYLRAHDKSQILNVLDGFEVPNNPRGVLMIATTNYPEIIDERIAKRPGRIDRIFLIPPIEDAWQAEQMLRRYMNTTYSEEHSITFPKLIGKTGAFVREAALHARMAALIKGIPIVSVEMLQQSIRRLDTQLESGPNLQAPFIVELQD
jgi:hypothetical protein